MHIYVGADHRGFGLKGAVIDYLKKAGYEAEDIGDKQFDPADDFPVFASAATAKVLTSDDSDPRAILICGSGQGMLMAANRIRGIRAGLGWSVDAARGIRNDEDSNVLALPADLFISDHRKAFVVIEAWLNTPYANAPRYNRRKKELDNLVQ